MPLHLYFYNGIVFSKQGVEECLLGKELSLQDLDGSISRSGLLTDQNNLFSSVRTWFFAKDTQHIYVLHNTYNGESCIGIIILIFRSKYLRKIPIQKD
jgi:hypothetical protein